MPNSCLCLEPTDLKINGFFKLDENKALKVSIGLLFPDRSNVCQSWSVMKKQGGDRCCGSNRKNMKFMKVTAG